MPDDAKPFAGDRISRYSAGTRSGIVAGTKETRDGGTEREEERMRKTLLSAVVMAALATTAIAQTGSVLNRYTAPNDVYGLTVAGSSVWGATFLDSPPVLYEFDIKTGNVLSSFTHAYTFPYGLGWDAQRNQFVLTSASHGTVARVDNTGAVTASFNVPTPRSIGVAHDAARDVYWVADWSADLLYQMDATSGSTLQTPFNLAPSGCTRAADVGFSAENDLIVIIGRDNETAYLYDAGNPPIFRRSVDLNPLNIRSGAKGCAIAPRRQTLYTDQTSTPLELLEIDLGLPRVEAADTVPVGRTLAITWTAGADAGLVYQAAASFTEGAGVRLGSRYVPLAVDPLFFLSLTTPALFGNFQGQLDGNGTATGFVQVPSIPMLSGQVFYLAFVTVDGNAPQGVKNVSGAWKVDITP